MHVAQVTVHLLVPATNETSESTKGEERPAYSIQCLCALKVSLPNPRQED